MLATKNVADNRIFINIYVYMYACKHIDIHRVCVCMYYIQTGMHTYMEMLGSSPQAKVFGGNIICIHTCICARIIHVYVRICAAVLIDRECINTCIINTRKSV
jgi:hypothetical protein